MIECFPEEHKVLGLIPTSSNKQNQSEKQSGFLKFKIRATAYIVWGYICSKIIVNFICNYNLKLPMSERQ